MVYGLLDGGTVSKPTVGMVIKPPLTASELAALPDSHYSKFELWFDDENETHLKFVGAPINANRDWIVADR
jgi:hypothetical protein